MATLPGTWRYRVSTGTGWPGVCRLWLGEMESLVCNFYLSVAARTIVWADLSLRYTGMLLGLKATNKQTPLGDPMPEDNPSPPHPQRSEPERKTDLTSAALLPALAAARWGRGRRSARRSPSQGTGYEPHPPQRRSSPPICQTCPLPVWYKGLDTSNILHFYYKGSEKSHILHLYTTKDLISQICPLPVHYKGSDKSYMPFTCYYNMYNMSFTCILQKTWQVKHVFYLYITKDLTSQTCPSPVLYTTKDLISQTCLLPVYYKGSDTSNMSFTCPVYYKGSDKSNMSFTCILQRIWHVKHVLHLSCIL